jgi:hypothetical protein
VIKKVTGWSVRLRRERGMEVKVWTNSRKGAANAIFGLGVSRSDRERFFNVAAPTVSIEADDHVITKTLPECFWNKCMHICHPAIGAFVKRHGFASWPSRKPPVLTLQPVSEGHFKLLTKEGR